MNEDAFEVPERTEYRYLVQEEEEGEGVQYVRHRHYINPLLVLSRRCIVLICLCVLALLTLATYLGCLAQTLPPGVAVVTTHCGKFRGRHVSPQTPRFLSNSQRLTVLITSESGLSHICKTFPVSFNGLISNPA